MNLKLYLRYICTVLLMSIMLIVLITMGIIVQRSDVFHSSYQSLIVDKYRLLQKTNEPKIIVVSGSSSSFGLDQQMLEQETGYKVVNLGLHGGFGHLFYSELAKENINPGDIVLLGYEYGWEKESGFDELGQDLIMSGIDDNIDMYKHIPIARWKDFLGYLFKYAEKKNGYRGSTGVYSRNSFDDETGQMTIYREYTLDYANNIEKYGKVEVYGSISDSSIRYLKKYKKYIEEKEASVYFISPPILRDAIASDYDCFQKLKEEEIEKIGIPFISNPEDYFFEEELMSDTIYHCSSKGEKVRTKILIDDLKKASIICE